ncbi:MAG TPA: hypothetical protein VE978_15455 [Chitinophagales bacterium]|nr:hypothetical protein [Chitinophagales bacterium]
MNLREEILKEHSKQQTIRLANWVGKEKKRFTELMNLFLHDEYRVVQRSAWIVKHVADEHPDWIKPWLKKMLEYCKQPVHDAVKRNVIRILTEIDLPKNLYGLAATICFDFLSSATEPVAVKVFSMTVLSNIAQHEPELKQELRLLIEDQMQWEKPGFTSRGRKILAQLEKDR